MAEKIVNLLKGGQRELDTSGWSVRGEALKEGLDAEERNPEMVAEGGSVGSGSAGKDDTAAAAAGSNSNNGQRARPDHSLPTPEEYDHLWGTRNLAPRSVRFFRSGKGRRLAGLAIVLVVSAGVAVGVTYAVGALGASSAQQPQAEETPPSASAGGSSLPADRDDPSSSSSSSEVSQITEALASITGSPLSTVGRRAVQWIVAEDDQRLGPDSSRLLQRFALACLYYGTNGPQWTLGDGGGGNNWLDGSKSECDFQGVTCDTAGNVAELYLSGAGMTGTLPDEVRFIATLTALDVSDNALGGAVPAALGALSRLEELHLQGNDMEGGNMPVQICLLREEDLTVLEADCGGREPRVGCSCCTKCHGGEGGEGTQEEETAAETATATAATTTRAPLVIDTSSREAGLRSVLEYHFAGTFASSSRAEAVNWIVNEDGAKLEPSDPRVIQRYVMAVTHFSLGGEDGAGWTVGGEGGESSRSSQVWLDGSKSECDFDGVACGSDGSIEGIALPSGNLKGYVPFELGALGGLKALDLSKNELQGEIPAVYGELPKLEILIMYGNNMSGKVPPSICDRKTAGEVRVLWMDCERVDCPCCTKCSEYYVGLRALS